MKKLTALLLSLTILGGLMSLPSSAAASPLLHLDFSKADYFSVPDVVGAKNAKIFGSREAVTGVGGKTALRLKGGYISLPPNVLCDQPAATISFWCSPAQVKVWTRFFDIGIDQENYLSLFSRRDFAESNKYKLSVELKQAGSLERADSAATYNLGQWQHFAVSVGGGLLKVYLGGVEVISISTNGKDLAFLKNATNSYIARSQFLADADLNAAFCDFKVFAGALSAAEIAEEYQSGASALPQEVETAQTINDGVTTVPGKKPTLPTKLSIGGEVKAVEWNNISNPELYSGLYDWFEVNGLVESEMPVSIRVTVSKTAFTNPLITHAQGGTADPFITLVDGWYYYCRQQDGGIRISRARRLQDIESAPRVLVAAPDDSGVPASAKREWWAPELHFIDGDFYIYFAADDGENKNHRMYVYKNDVRGDALSHFSFVGMVRSDTDAPHWAIDATVIQDGEKLYFVWSGWEGDTDGRQDIYISEMESPLKLKGERVKLSDPRDTEWERKSNQTPYINEGPQILYRGGKIYIFYSACPSWNDWYQLGMITANAGDNLALAASWTKKTDGPVFMQSTDPADKAMSTGHASFTTSLDGSEDFVVYHAFDISHGSDGWGNRSARAQKISWQGDEPIFGNPAPWGELTAGPSDTPAAVLAKYQAEEATLTGGAAVISRSHASEGKAVDVRSGSVEFKVTAPKAGLYSLGIMANAFADRAKPNTMINVGGRIVPALLFYGKTENAQNNFQPASSVSNSPTSQRDIIVFLKKGVNSIKFGGDGRIFELDYIKLIFIEPRSLTNLDFELIDVIDTLKLAAADGYEDYLDVISDQKLTAADALEILKSLVTS